MKTFLVPVDFSAVTEEIISAASTFARAFNGKVVLLHTVQPQVITSEYALPVEALQETMVAQEKNSAIKLTEHAAQFHAAGIAAETLVRHGPPETTILEVATEVKADFIIMGSHGHGRLYDLLVGSTASGVLKGAKCGVIIMPPVDKNKAA
jgi:nucleotide-binding universal stress UspA family protein